MAELHIIEPTLADQTGHCHGYVQSLIEANQQAGYDLHVWLNRKGFNLYALPAGRTHAYFSRRLRQLQKIFCLRKLIQTKKTIFIPTAGRTDFILLNWLLRRIPQTAQPKIFLHFHQFKVNAKKIAILKKMAQQHQQLIIMAPTQALLDIFRQCGFVNCEQVPCPGYAPPLNLNANTENAFSKVIYAGAARADKGFPELIEFVKHLASQSIALPLEIQISPPFSGRYDEKSARAVKQLKQLSLVHLKLHEQTLDKIAYQQLFKQAICLLIYDPIYYQNKFSGVALDAFYAGCPVVVVANTWAGDNVQRFQAGIVLADRSPASILQAVQKIRENYAYYSEQAKQASEILQREHDPINTLRVISKYQGL